MKGYLGEDIRWFFGLGAMNAELPKAEICRMDLEQIREHYTKHFDMDALLKKIAEWLKDDEATQVA